MSEQITPYQLHHDITKFHQKKLLIFTNSSKNLLELSREDSDAYKCYKKLLKNDYILYFHENGISKFYKRQLVSELWKRKDLHQYKDLFYTITPPPEDKINHAQPSKLLILFPCMPPIEDLNSALIPKRMFTEFFKTIHKYLVKNVYIVRIMDLNCSHGSHFCNTVNYPTMESDIQACLEDIIATLNIDKNNTVLYGASKGGTGALLHGSVLDLKVLAVDPILNLAEYNLNDFHYLKDFRIEDLTSIINNNLIHNHKTDKYLICSPAAEFNYQQTHKLDPQFIHKIVLKDHNMTQHANISKNCVAEQVMLLNKLLSGLI